MQTGSKPGCYTLNPVIFLEAPLSMSQSLLPCVTVPVREKIKTYSSSLEEYSSLNFFLGGLSSSTV